MPQKTAQKGLMTTVAEQLHLARESKKLSVHQVAAKATEEVIGIGPANQPIVARVAEEQYEDQNRKVQTLVDNVAKNAPAGSETAVAVMKSAITAANTTYETIHKASKQAVEIAESNFNAAATAATKAASQATAQASRVAKKTV